VPEWKWEEIAIDFIVGLLRTQLGYDSIGVIVDQLTERVNQILEDKLRAYALQYGRS
jgi:hypothetical protein